MMKIHLPNNAWIHTMDPFLRSIDFSEPTTLEITSSEKWISLHPMIHAMLAALGARVDKDNTTTPVNIFNVRGAQNLYKIGLGNYINLPELATDDHEEAGQYVSVHQIRTAAEQSAFVTSVVPLLHLNPHYALPIQHVLSELIRNVIEHAGTPNGAFATAQYYKKNNTVRIGIADTGIGIRKSIARSHVVTSDKQAIAKALTPGITGATSREGGNEQNAGAGLFITKSIAAVNGDSFLLYSGDSFYKLLKQPESKRHILHADPTKDKHTFVEGLPYFQGTAIGFDMKLDDTDAFASIMALIRETYAAAIKERKSARREPKFI